MDHIEIRGITLYIDDLCDHLRSFDTIRDVSLKALLESLSYPSTESMRVLLATLATLLEAGVVEPSREDVILHLPEINAKLDTPVTARGCVVYTDGVHIVRVKGSLPVAEMKFRMSRYCRVLDDDLTVRVSGSDKDFAAVDNDCRVFFSKKGGHHSPSSGAEPLHFAPFLADF